MNTIATLAAAVETAIEAAFFATRPTALRALAKRLPAAAAAASVTLALFSAVVGISEPNRSELVAVNNARQAVQAAQAQQGVQTVAQASAAGR